MAATALCVAVVAPMFSMPMWQVAFAVGLSCLVAVLAVEIARSDKPISIPSPAWRKLSQIVFAVVAPGHVVANIVAGALAEAGAMQAGDLLPGPQGGPPAARLATRAVLRPADWRERLCRRHRRCLPNVRDRLRHPFPQFPAPVANVWKDMAVLMQKGRPRCRPRRSVTRRASA